MVGKSQSLQKYSSPHINTNRDKYKIYRTKGKLTVVSGCRTLELVGKRMRKEG